MNSSAARHYDKSSWWVLGANSIILKHWSDCLCHVALGRTDNRIRSTRWTASSFWVYAGKGSRQITSVTLEKGLAQRVTWDAINYCFVWYCVMQLIRVGVVTPRLGNTKRCLRLITNFELKRTRRIRLFNIKHSIVMGRKSCSHNVISAQCFEYQHGEIQTSAGKRRE